MTLIVNVLLGAFILRERLSAWQTASILIALVAVHSRLYYGHFPWIAVGFAPFRPYGLLRNNPAPLQFPLFWERFLSCRWPWFILLSR